MVSCFEDILVKLTYLNNSITCLVLNMTTFVRFGIENHNDLELVRFVIN